MTKRTEKAQEMLRSLEKLYPDAECALNYESAWQLLVATILSAQCTDVRVNMVTEILFKEIENPQQMAVASQDQVENLIRTTGFFRNKAKNLIMCARQLLERHSGDIPESLEELVALAGVGRKTANVVLGNAFNIPGMVVDTHVKRLSRRFGWTKANDPEKIEQDLCKLLPAEEWTQCSHTLIAHGRACCKAPIPLCSRCQVSQICRKVGVDRAR